MDKLLGMVKSRTVWTVVLMVLFNGLPAVHNLVSPGWAQVIDVVLGALAVYFRVNPVQEF